VSPVRIWLVGFGTVGRWVAGTLAAQSQRLAGRYGAEVAVVGIASARDGFTFRDDGFGAAELAAAASGARPASGLPGTRHWPATIDGLRATEADLLVEVSASADGGEPGVTHMREALRRRIPVVTSNKWPVARHGAELAALAGFPAGAVPRRVDGDVRHAGDQHTD